MRRQTSSPGLPRSPCGASGWASPRTRTLWSPGSAAGWLHLPLPAHHLAVRPPRPRPPYSHPVACVAPMGTDPRWLCAAAVVLLLVAWTKAQALTSDVRDRADAYDRKGCERSASCWSSEPATRAALPAWSSSTCGRTRSSRSSTRTATPTRPAAVARRPDSHRRSDRRRLRGHRVVGGARLRPRIEEIIDYDVTPFVDDARFPSTTYENTRTRPDRSARSPTSSPSDPRADPERGGVSGTRTRPPPSRRAQTRTCSSLAAVDFDDTPEEAAFRAEARAWLEANAIPKGHPDDFSAGMWSTGLLRGRLRQALPGVAGRAGRRGLGRHHLAHGRRRAGRPSRSSRRIFNQEQARFGVSNGVFAIAIGMVGPTLLAHGTDEQKQRYLPADAPGRRGVVPALQRARGRAPTSPTSPPGPCATATSGSSPARRCGPPRPSGPSGASCSPAPTPTRPSTRASPTSCVDMAHARASTSGRCAR